MAIPVPITDFSWAARDTGHITVAAPTYDKEFPQFNIASKANIDSKIEADIQRAQEAYFKDGTIRQTVDRFSEAFHTIELESLNEKALAYIKERLARISFTSGEPWQATLNRAFEDVWRLGNAVILLKRGTIQGVDTAMYADRPYPIVALELFPVTNLTAVRVNGRVAFKRRDNQEVSVLQPGTKPVPKFLINKMVADKKDKVFIHSLDCVHLYYKKVSGATWGWGITFSAFNDILALKAIEQAVAIAHKRFQAPIIHLQIKQFGNNSTDKDLLLAKQEINRMDPNAIYVSDDMRNFTVHGSESQLLRSDPVMSHFVKRGFSGLATTPFEQGFEGGTLGSAEATRSLAQAKKKRTYADLCAQFEMHVINQLLVEGGFDIFNPENLVKLKLTDLEENDLIKRRAAAADLFTKGVIDLRETRQISGFLDLPETTLMVHRIMPRQPATTPKTGNLSIENSKTLENTLLYLEEAHPGVITPEIRENIERLKPDYAAIELYLNELTS